VLNLASWGEQRRPLAEWLVAELYERYKLARPAAQRLLDTDQLILLLDGLDEVHAELRTDCVRAINVFRVDRTVDLVVCYRTADYETLNAQLTLQAAIALDPLTPEQIDHALAERGDALAVLRTHLAHDEALRALAAAPLMLSIMTLVYHDTAPETASPNQEHDARQQLFDRYVAHVLSRRGAARYDARQTQRCLAWLARRMQVDSQTVFYPDQLQADWLTLPLRRWYTLLDRLGSALLGGLALSLFYLVVLGLYALVAQPHPVYAEGIGLDTLAVLLLGSLVGGLFGTISERPYLHNDVIWPQALERIVGLIGGGLLFGLVAAAMTGSLVGAIMGSILGAWAGALAPLPSLRPRRITVVEPRRWSWRRTLRLLPACLSGGAALGLLMGALIDESEIGGLLGPLLGPVYGSIVAGLLNGLSVSLAFGLSHAEAIHEPDRPNQGIRRSLHNALLSGGLGFVLGGLLGFYVAIGPVTWLILGAQSALVSALAFGLFTVLSHATLRIVLWQSGAAPLRYLHFLDHCVDHILLRRIGGGYSFVHQELLNHFATLEQAPDWNAESIGHSVRRASGTGRLSRMLADLAGLALLTAIICGAIMLVRQSFIGDMPSLPPAAVRIAPGPGYSGRVVSDHSVWAGDYVHITAHGRIDIGAFERDVPSQGRERGFLGLPLGNSFKLIERYPTGALLARLPARMTLCGGSAAPRRLSRPRPMGGWSSWSTITKPNSIAGVLARLSILARRRSDGCVGTLEPFGCAQGKGWQVAGWQVRKLTG
jgi:hypothetical protein